MLILALAILLLWAPRQWLRWGGRIGHGQGRHRSHDTEIAHDPDDRSVQLRAEVRKTRNWIDLVRAAAGGIAVKEFAFGLADGSNGHAAHQVFLWQATVLVIAVLLQTVRYEIKLSLFPPIFFLIGLSFGLCGPEAAIFALVLVCAFNAMLPNPAAFLGIYAVILAGFGFLYYGGHMGDIRLLSCALFLLPVVISVLARHPLVLFAKKAVAVEREVRK